MKIIAVEGLDGSGKTTFSQKLANDLKENGFTVELIHPFCTEIGQVCKDEINRIYGERNGNILPQRAKFWIDSLCKDAMDYLRDYFIPSVDKKCDYLIIDRYFYTTIAYGSSVDDELDYANSFRRPVAVFFCCDSFKSIEDAEDEFEYDNMQREKDILDKYFRIFEMTDANVIKQTKDLEERRAR